MEPVRAHHHAVQFYGTDDELFETVGIFLSEGLAARQPLVVVATEAHRKAIEATLVARLVDVARARSVGDLVLLDADEVLDTFMVDGMPDASLFNKVVGGVIEQTLHGRERTPLRAYGEMVDVLWKQENTDAAVRLEELWNDLATTHDFSLLCGYAIAHFYKETARYENVRRLHTHVHEHERAAQIA